jgi:hypothetical protein
MRAIDHKLIADAEAAVTAQDVHNLAGTVANYLQWHRNLEDGCDPETCIECIDRIERILRAVGLGVGLRKAVLANPLGPLEQKLDERFTPKRTAKVLAVLADAEQAGRRGAGGEGKRGRQQQS